jgi:hypothetical protein
VSIRIFYQHFAYAPIHIFRWRKYPRSARFDGFIIFIHIINKDRKPGSRVSLAFLTKEDVYGVPSHSSECGRSTPIPSALEAQYIGVIIEASYHISGI